MTALGPVTDASIIGACNASIQGGASEALRGDLKLASSVNKLRMPFARGNFPSTAAYGGTGRFAALDADIGMEFGHKSTKWRDIDLDWDGG